MCTRVKVWEQTGFTSTFLQKSVNRNFILKSVNLVPMDDKILRYTGSE